MWFKCQTNILFSSLINLKSSVCKINGLYSIQDQQTKDMLWNHDKIKYEGPIYSDTQVNLLSKPLEKVVFAKMFLYTCKTSG